MMSLIRRGSLLALLAMSVAGLVSLWDAQRPAQALFWSYSEAWCARMDGGYDDCAYYTYEQCRAAASGNGNTCVPNPLYVPRAGTRSSGKQKRQYYR